uniref:DnaJ homolog subfamily C member 8 (inferred by orthology to a human protein) n=1 Tax=Strongyloides venezuelensis TaxID=75913 RepID=A0A0K0FGU5_STRVS
MDSIDEFERFYTDLKTLEKKDAVLTSAQQIDRLLKPGSTYLNLNPFEVLQIDPESSLDDCKKRFKRLSVLVHPDKNPDDRERADRAFDILKKAIEAIEDPGKLAKIKDGYAEARARLAIMMSEKRRKLKKEGKSVDIPEDTPEGYSKMLWVVVTKVFADRERKRKMLEEREQNEKIRKAEEATKAAEKRKLEEEFKKNYEESRDERRVSWRNFVQKKEAKGKPFSGNGYKLPNNKMEAPQPPPSKKPNLKQKY